jgi:transcriptional regulator with XRE-family HTH domain
MGMTIMDSRIFWNNVKSYRMGRHITVGVIAEALGINPDVYSEIENHSTKEVSQELQERASVFFDKPIEEFWDYYIAPMPFWDNEKKYRIAKEIPTEELAKTLGFKGRQGIHIKESRKNPIRASEAKRFAAALGTTLEVLTDTDKTAETIDKFANVSQDDRTEFYSFIELRDKLPTEVYQWLFKEDTADKLIKLYEISRG